MTTPNPMSVVRPVDASCPPNGCDICQHDWPCARLVAKSKQAEEALPLARSLIKEHAELVEAKEGLEWLIKNFSEPYKQHILGRLDCPTCVKQYLEGK